MYKNQYTEMQGIPLLAPFRGTTGFAFEDQSKPLSNAKGSERCRAIFDEINVYYDMHARVFLKKTLERKNRGIPPRTPLGSI